MSEQAITLLGKSTGSTVDATMDMDSQWFGSETAYLELPEGLDAELQVESLDSESATWAWVELSEDGGSTWDELGRPLRLSADGHVDVTESRAPVEVAAKSEGLAGGEKTRLRLRLNQSAVGKTRFSLTARFVSPDTVRTDTQ